MTKQEKDVLRIARAYGLAVERVMKVHDELTESIRKLDEFHPRHVAWENKLFRAEQNRDRQRDALHRACYRFAGGGRKELT